MTIQIQKQFDNLEDGIQNMIDAAIYDYGQWMQPDTETRIKMNKEFAEGWVVKTGLKYAKIMQKNGGKFGDLLLRWIPTRSSKKVIC